MDAYILNGREPVPATYQEWANWLEKEQWPASRVAEDRIGDARVSTVFLGLDHRFGDEGPPVLFETMVFDGKHDGDCERCCTWDQAEAMHKAMCDRLTAEVAGETAQDGEQAP